MLFIWGSDKHTADVWVTLQGGGVVIIWIYVALGCPGFKRSDRVVKIILLSKGEPPTPAKITLSWAEEIPLLILRIQGNPFSLCTFKPFWLLIRRSDFKNIQTEIQMRVWIIDFCKVFLVRKVHLGRCNGLKSSATLVSPVEKWLQETAWWMKGYGLRAQEPSRETQISREIFKWNLHIRRYWTITEKSPPILPPHWPMAARNSVRHVFIGQL